MWRCKRQRDHVVYTEAGLSALSGGVCPRCRAALGVERAFPDWAAVPGIDAAAAAAAAKTRGFFSPGV